MKNQYTISFQLGVLILGSVLDVLILKYHIKSLNSCERGDNFYDFCKRKKAGLIFNRLHRANC